MLMHLTVMASSSITALNKLLSPLLSQQQGNFSYQDPQHLYFLPLPDPNDTRTVPGAGEVSARSAPPFPVPPSLPESFKDMD